MHHMYDTGANGLAMARDLVALEAARLTAGYPETRMKGLSSCARFRILTRSWWCVTW